MSSVAWPGHGLQRVVNDVEQHLVELIAAAVRGAGVPGATIVDPTPDWRAMAAKKRERAFDDVRHRLAPIADRPRPRQVDEVGHDAIQPVDLGGDVDGERSRSVVVSSRDVR